jgi:hypothetical protein
MYKLVAVGGKLRGKEYILEDGDNVLGRGMECNHVLEVNGVSKNHMKITVNGSTAYVQDLGSSNGTFVNGKLVKKATVKSKDKIALPNVIFQVVYVKEKKIIVKKKVAKQEETDDGEIYLDKEPMPASPVGKIKYLFKHKVMPIIYGFNESYEWAAMLGILLFIFIVINSGLTISPVLRDTNRILFHELSQRGNQYAREVARTNRIHLIRKNYDQLDTQFLDNDTDIAEYDILEPSNEGIIIAPARRRNKYTNDTFTIEAMKEILAQKSMKPIMKRLGGGEIGVASAISGNEGNIVGIISLRFAPQSLIATAGNNTKSYLEAIGTSGIVGIFFFGLIYFLTIRHVDEMRVQIENVLRGKQKELGSTLLMKEISPLRNTINSLLQRLKELQSAETGEFNEIEDEGPYVRTLEEFMRGTTGAAMILNSEKMIHRLNNEGEDLTGLRENSSQGTSLLDSLRDQGFAATVIDLCDQSANNEGCNQQEIYEINGREHEINVVSLIGKDSFAKGFFITFLREE